MPELNEGFYDHALTLPAGGKLYTIPSPDFDIGLRVHRLVTISRIAVDGADLDEDDKQFLRDMPDRSSEEFFNGLLSPEVFAQMRADKVNWSDFQRITQTVMIWIAEGRGTAEEFWKAEADGPKPSTPTDHKPAAVRTASSRASSPRKRSGNPAKRATAGERSSTAGPSSRPTSTSSTD